MKHVLGFFGLKGAGKDTAAEALRDRALEKHDFGVRIYKFATPLKRMAAALMREPVHLMNGDTEASREFRERENELLTDITDGKITTPRVLLQWLGTEIGRQFHKDIWVKLLEHEIKDDKTPIIAITDCRFPNEMDLIKRLGGTCVLVNRAGLENKDSHASEAMPFDEKDFDVKINNTSDLNSFKQVAGRALFRVAILESGYPKDIDTSKDI